MPGAVERSLSRLNRPSRRAAGPGKRHSARGTPRAQPRDVRSAGRDTWNLTGDPLPALDGQSRARVGFCGFVSGLTRRIIFLFATK